MQGKLLIFTGPSGSGKSTLTRHILDHYDDFELSVSACTREKRANEMNGVHYYFMSVDEFKRKIDEGAFVEWEEVYEGKFYGTLRSELERIWNKGKHVVFDIDVMGAYNLKKQFPDRALAILVKPPSIETLKDRLEKRSTESEEMLETRLAKAERELNMEKAFDLSVTNEDIEKTCQKINAFVNAFLNKP